MKDMIKMLLVLPADPCFLYLANPRLLSFTVSNTVTVLQGNIPRGLDFTLQSIYRVVNASVAPEWCQRSGGIGWLM